MSITKFIIEVGKYSFKFQKLLGLILKLSLENNKKVLNLFFYLAFQKIISLLNKVLQSFSPLKKLHLFVEFMYKKVVTIDANF
jgi:hypothetical protein